MINHVRAYIKSVIIEMEGANKPGHSPYKASFAGVGDSGLSYGEMQNDVGRKDKYIVDTFLAIIHQHPEFDAAEKRDAETWAKTPGVKETDIPPLLLAKINRALSSPNGVTKIKAQDSRQFNFVATDVEYLLSEARKNPAGAGVFDPSHKDFPTALAMAAAWANKVRGERGSYGRLDRMAKWAKGEEVSLEAGKLKLAGAPTLADLHQYLASTQHWMDQAKSGKGEQLATWEGRIQVAVPLALGAQPQPTTPQPPKNVPNQMRMRGRRAGGEAGGETRSVAAMTDPAVPPSLLASNDGGTESIPVSLSIDSLPMPSLLAASAPPSEPTASDSDAPPVVDASSSTPPAPDTDSGFGGKLHLARTRTDQALRNLTPARLDTGSPGAEPSGGAQPSLPSVLPELNGGPVFDAPTSAPSAVGEIEATAPEASSALVDLRINAIEATESIAEDTAPSAAEVEIDVGAAFNAAEEALEVEIAAALTAIETLRRARRRFPGMLMDRDGNVMTLTSISATWPSDAAETESGNARAGGSGFPPGQPGPKPPAESPLTEKRVRQLIREGIDEWDSGFGVRYRSRHITFIRDR